LKVSGERNIKGNKWCRFQKSFQLPKNSEISKIGAKFDNGVLYVMVPKPSVMEQASSQNDNTTTTAIAAATTSTGEQQSDESEGKSLKENNEGPVPVQGVVRNLLKQKLVILNVVIVVILLALVLFRRNKLADGDNIGDHMDSTAPY
jgi:Hsp20/alpha crystallin family